MNEFDEKKFAQMWETTEPVLTSREIEKIRSGVWSRVRKHRRAVKFRAMFATAAVIILAVLIAVNPFSSRNDIDQSDFFIASKYDYWQSLEKIPEDELIYSLLETDIDSIDNALIYQSDVETAMSLLSDDEQEELLVALAEEM